MRISLFPLTPETKTIIEYSNLMSSYSISCIASFKEDQAYLAELEQSTGILCTTSIDEALKRSDALVLLDNVFQCRMDKYYLCIQKAKQLNKPVFSSRSLIKSFENADCVKYVHPFQNEYPLDTEHFTHIERLLEIKVPIVTVMGLGENCSKFECLLQFKTYLDSLEYKIHLISSNDLGVLMGMGTLPSFLFDSTKSFPHKVFEFNRYIYGICDAYNPDLLVIGVPSGIVSLSEKDTNFFSEIPLVISTALSVDAGILTFYYQKNISEEYLKSMSDYCNRRFNIPTDAFFVSRQKIEYDTEWLKTRYLFLSERYLKENPVKNNSYLALADPLHDNEDIYKSVIDTLVQNLETV